MCGEEEDDCTPSSYTWPQVSLGFHSDFIGQNSVSRPHLISGRLEYREGRWPTEKKEMGFGEYSATVCMHKTVVIKDCHF